MTASPAPIIRDHIVQVLRAAEAEPIMQTPECQIRAALDVSGEPRGPYGIIVAAADLGGHGGLPGRVLVDVRVTITVFTHLDEDADGHRLDDLAAAVMETIPSIGVAVPGWHIRFPGVWQLDEATMDDVFRTADITATLYLQACNP